MALCVFYKNALIAGVEQLNVGELALGVTMSSLAQLPVTVAITLPQVALSLFDDVTLSHLAALKPCVGGRRERHAGRPSSSNHISH